MKKNYTLLLLLSFFTYITQGQCTFGNDIGSFDPQNNFDWAQSFTAECDGFLEYVEFITGSGGTQQARTLEIFEGATVSGEPFYTQDFPLMSFGAAGESLRIVLEEDFPILEGDEFTFQIPGVTVNLLVDINNPYPGGFAFENGGEFNQVVDFVFNVSITDESLSTNQFALTDVSVYPNPTTDQVTVSFGQTFQEAQLTVYNVQGAVVQQENALDTSAMETNISKLTSGIYLVVLQTEIGTANLKLIKN